jgi:hypothetical protein
LKPLERKTRLEALLLGFQTIWRPQPFKIETPEWCTDYPALTAELLALDDLNVERLSTDNPASIGFLAGHMPELAELAGLIDLPFLDPDGSRTGKEDDRLFTDIPGRKQAQILAYAGAIGEPAAPVLEWCAGKGHLGRLLAHRWQRPVASLEIDATLCAAGEHLARRTKADAIQHFIHADALEHQSARHLTGRHAIALHACGDLHTRLVTEAVARNSPALDLVPCCYYRTVAEPYVPMSGGQLTLSRDDLHLAVTETVTASPRLQRRSRQALAWKLAWLELRRQLIGEDGYRSFPSVPETWLRGDFSAFAVRMAERAAIDLRPDHDDLTRFEALGHARAARMLRLQLPRLAFRRALEVWLVMDMAVYLEQNGYRVEVATFCPRDLTPRNLLLSARRM